MNRQQLLDFAYDCYRKGKEDASLTHFASWLLLHMPSVENPKKPKEKYRNT